MPDSPTTLDNIFSEYKNRAGDKRITKLEFIKDLNPLLFAMGITKPCEMVDKLYYCKTFENYPIPTQGFRNAIGLYVDTAPFNSIRYVSPLRFRLEDPSIAYTDQTDAGKRYLKVRHENSNSLASVMTEADDLTADGTWSASDSQTLAINNTTYKKGSGSLAFSITAATDITLTFTKTSAIDATTYTEQMRLRLFAWLPTKPTSITLRVGNDSSNYFEQTVTTQVTGEVFLIDAVNEIELVRNDATETGSVTESAIDWFQIKVAFSASTTDTDFLLNHITLLKPEAMDLEWYTNYIAIDANGVLQQSITESATTTDEPIIKDYPDYIDTVINGLVARFLQNKAPARAKKYEEYYLGTQKGGPKLQTGLAYLREQYPSRAAKYKRKSTLPDLYNSRIRA